MNLFFRFALNRVIAAAVISIAFGAAGLAVAQTFNVLHEFDRGTEGIRNSSPLIQGLDGRLYGTSQRGGKYLEGTVFRLNADGSGFEILHHLNGSQDDGANAYGGVIQASDGRLYGTTLVGGTIFGLNPDGTGFAVLHRSTFSSGSSPYAGLIEGSDGRLYGTASAGGVNSGGTIFALNRDGTGFAVLRHLTSLADGRTPRASLLQGADGRLYGAAIEGGANGGGTIFALNPDGSSFVVLRHLTTTSDGGSPYAGLIRGFDGRLFGVNRVGGSSNAGTVFALQPDGSGFTVLKNLQVTAGTAAIWPEGRLVQSSDGRLIGTTHFQSNSVIFSVRPDGTGYSVLDILNRSTEGAFLKAGLLIASDGRLYGTAEVGGVYENGTIFRLNIDGSNFSVLRHSDYRALGDNPRGRLLEGADGTLYGTTYSGASDDPNTNGDLSQFGTLFKIDPNGSNFTVLRNFVGQFNGRTIGGNLTTGVVLSDDGRFYGGITNGLYGRGALYAVQPDGTGFTIVHSFGLHPDGSSPPTGALVKGADGRLYGMTSDTASRIFAIDANGSGYTILRTLAPSEGTASPGQPGVGLIAGSDGRLYGLANSSGTGTIFRLNPDGTGFSVLHTFQSVLHGNSSYDILIEGSDDRLYGTNSQGGPAGGGTVFGINKDGTGFAVVHAFAGGAPSIARTPRGGLVEGLDGKLYGTTAFGPFVGGVHLGGTFFSVNKNGTGFSVVHQFDYTTDGLIQQVSLTRGTNGTIYGADGQGGSFANSGMLFSYAPASAPAITSPLTAAGVFNQAFNYTITATNSPDDFDAMNLPANLTTDHPTGLISGLPQVTGVFPVDIAASNAAGTGLAILNLTIAKAAATITLGDLSQVYDSTAKSVSATTAPAGLPVNLTYNDSTTAPTAAGIFAVVAAIASPNYTGTTSGTLTIAKAPATIALANTAQTYDGAPRAVTATTNPAGLSVTITYDGSASAPTNSGSYAVVATINHANYAGTTSGTLTIAKAVATISLANTTQVYNGTPRTVTATTRPAGLLATFTYDGSATAPTNAGEYTVAATLTDANFIGSTTGTLVITKATAGIVLSNTSQTYDATPKSVTVTTTPAGLPTTITYDGATAAPINAGTYAVVATITDPNQVGTATATLVISAIAPVPVNVSSSLAITRGGFRLNRVTRRFAQTITVTNTSPQTIGGPVSLVFDALSPNAMLFAPAGSTSAAAPLGSPFVNLNVGPDGALSPGESVSRDVEFTNASNASITYTTRALAGAGTR